MTENKKPGLCLQAPNYAPWCQLSLAKPKASQVIQGRITGFTGF
jgi:hypothetical protein